MDLLFGLYMALIGATGVFASLALIAAASILLKRFFANKNLPGTPLLEDVESMKGADAKAEGRGDIIQVNVDNKQRNVAIQALGVEKDSDELLIPEINEETKIMIDDEEHTIKITTPTPPSKALGKQEIPTVAKHVIRAPMRGNIIKIPVKIGEKVQNGAVLIILETMKMENAIASPIIGTIKTVDVSEGDSVEPEQILITID